MQRDVLRTKGTYPGICTHIRIILVCAFAQNWLVSLQCCWELKVLNRVSFEWMDGKSIIHFTVMFKTKKNKHGTYELMKCALTCFLLFGLPWRICQLTYKASPLALTTTRILIWAAAHALQTQIHQSLGNCVVGKTVAIVMSTFRSPKLAITHNIQLLVMYTAWLPWLLQHLNDSAI